MIRVTFFKHNGNYFRFESSGHSEFDEYGKDIVCSAVSTLAQTLVNSIFKLGIVDPTVQVEDDGYLNCEISTDQNVLENIEIQTIFKVIKIGIEGISEVYNENVELLEEEV